jgi:PAS domain S-box-containing protein
MKLLRDLPIRRKITLWSMLVCGAVLVLVLGGLFAYQWWSFRTKLIDELVTAADIIAAGTGATLAYQDRRDAKEVLATLAAQPGIRCASFVLGEGVELGRYGIAETPEQIRDYPTADDMRWVGSNLLLTRSVRFQGRNYGKLLLRADYHKLVRGELARLYSVILPVVLGASFLLAFVFSTALHSTITRPVLSLAETARAIAQRGELSTRAQKFGNDELGQFTEDFNRMLGQIQEGDRNLRQANLALQTEVAERRRAEGALSESERRYRVLFESNPMPMFFYDLQSLRVLGVNEACVRHYGYTRQEFQELTIKDIRPAADIPRLLDSLKNTALYQRSDGWRHLTKSGAIIDVEITSHALILEGRATRLVLVNDITEQKRVEAERERLHSQLLEASRRAGMADVATSVLHNVGNVLNSINVSTSLVHESIRHSHARDLGRVVDLIRQHQGHLAAYLENDPKGSRITDYLGKLSQQLERERARMSVELDALVRHVDHIKRIVSMQQDLAKAGGVMEPTDLAGLMDQALGIHESSLARHDVHVQRVYAPLPKVLVDPHAVLQILVNLISNARQAMSAAPVPSLRLTLRVGPDPARPDWAALSVTDTGIGIHPEQMPRLFTQGFTTREDGHGFGLHSGALAARLMGGTLEAQSPGPGQGATFTLALPIDIG